jgi:hypothetical protein
MTRRTKIAIRKNVKRFFKKFFWRFLSRVLEIALLGFVGYYAFGLQLVRY